MPPSRSHLFAAAVLGLGGGLLAVTSLAIVAARALLATGVPGIVATSQDVALLDDLIAVLPFIVAFAAANVVAAVGLVVGRPWAPGVTQWVSVAAVVTGLTGLGLLIAGSWVGLESGTGRPNDPDGLAVISLFVGLYAWAAVAVRWPTYPRPPVAGSAAA